MNRVIHFEIHATDTAKLADFYRHAFSWDVKKWDNPNFDYWIVMTAPDGSLEPGINGGIVGRKGSSPQAGQPVSSFVCTIEVQNLEDSIATVESLGGKNVVPKSAIPGLAWLAYCIDPEGNVFGLYQADKEAK